MNRTAEAGKTLHVAFGTLVLVQSYINFLYWIYLLA